ncbi:MAG: hypothetical protein ACRDZU_04190 [Acidimicrobiales bacterium]
MARTPVDDLANAIKDATYVSVGLGVIAFQRLQVRRNELAKAISGPAEEARGTLEVLGAVVGERVKLVEERISAVLNR